MIVSVILIWIFGVDASVAWINPCQQSRPVSIQRPRPISTPNRGCVSCGMALVPLPVDDLEEFFLEPRPASKPLCSKLSWRPTVMLEQIRENRREIGDSTADVLQ